jgi:DNA-binding transcriptional LysR family regulator
MELLQVTTASEDWATWLASAGAADIDLTRGLRFDTIHFAVEAAIQGLGVAIGRLPLISREFESGRLVRLFGPDVSAATSYWLVGAPETLRRPEVAAFKNWLQEQAGAAVPT